ncbi:citrate synthase [Natronosporangium hydrolyticum]|uniref:Citrate synthase n=1 Tax=Natronosporangium hydrolyticum TaxID=2811111 RepID=A0A895Y5S4_9ACTN|nr:citrate synthase [Natronosporangium hydrolyticum]QSB13067.1 citrate synthase [Natronosporangium hydrolyticum]
MSQTIEVPRGLAGVVVTDTELSDVQGEAGFYHYRQYSAVDLAEQCSLEEVWALLLDGELPSPAARDSFAAEVARLRTLPPALRPLLPAIATTAGPLDGLRTALSLAGAARNARALRDLNPAQRRMDALFAGAVTPTIVAALHRLRHGQQPIDPHPELPYAANYLYQLTGVEPDPRHARAIEQYLISTIEHGFNASTFTARVIAATGADLFACLCGAIGALSGPLHGGAPSRALETLEEIGTPDRIDAEIRRRIATGERIMGFGHPVYRTADPRSVLLRNLATALGGELAEFAITVEERVLALLAELKPGRPLHTNVEFYAAVVMDQCGLPRDLFTPTFACSRVIGWGAHILEQAQDPKIIRPAARYTGPPAPQPVPTIG